MLLPCCIFQLTFHYFLVLTKGMATDISCLNWCLVSNKVTFFIGSGLKANCYAVNVLPFSLWQNTWNIFTRSLNIHTFEVLFHIYTNYNFFTVVLTIDLGAVVTSGRHDASWIPLWNEDQNDASLFHSEILHSNSFHYFNIWCFSWELDKKTLMA